MVLRTNLSIGTQQVADGYVSLIFLVIPFVLLCPVTLTTIIFDSFLLFCASFFLFVFV